METESLASSQRIGAARVGVGLGLFAAAISICLPWAALNRPGDDWNLVPIGVPVLRWFVIAWIIVVTTIALIAARSRRAWVLVIALLTTGASALSSFWVGTLEKSLADLVPLRHLPDSVRRYASDAGSGIGVWISLVAWIVVFGALVVLFAGRTRPAGARHRLRTLISTGGASDGVPLAVSSASSSALPQSDDSTENIWDD